MRNIITQSLLLLSLMVTSGCTSSKGGWRVYSGVNGQNDKVALSYARQVVYTPAKGYMKETPWTVREAEKWGIVASGTGVISCEKPSISPGLVEGVTDPVAQLAFLQALRGSRVVIDQSQGFKAETVRDENEFLDELNRWNSSKGPRTEAGQLILQKAVGFSWSHPQNKPSFSE